MPSSDLRTAVNLAIEGMLRGAPNHQEALQRAKLEIDEMLSEHRDDPDRLVILSLIKEEIELRILAC